MNKRQTLIFIGRSGCGKGTQAKLLLERLKTETSPVLYIETGDKFRDFVAGTSHSSRRAREVMERSERQPDFLAVWMWAHIVIENLMGDEHLVFDGTPRSLTEAQILDTALRFYDRGQTVVVHLNISREESKKRMELRGRGDDKKPGDIDKRLDWFDRDVKPAIDYYRNNSNYHFIELDGEQSIEKIQQDLIEKLDAIV